MFAVNKTRQLKGKLAAIKLKLNLMEKRNDRLVLALEYYSKYYNNLFGVGPKVAREALRD